MAEFSIRRAVAADEQGVIHCIDRAYAGYASSIPDLPAVSEGIIEDINSNIVWIAELNGEIAGVLVLVQSPDHLVLANVAVDPDQKGKGLGKALMNQAENEAVRLEISVLRLSTHIDMPQNVSLYAHLGWHETGRDGNKVHMSKLIMAQWDANKKPREP